MLIMFNCKRPRLVRIRTVERYFNRIVIPDIHVLGFQLIDRYSAKRCISIVIICAVFIAKV